MTSYYLAPNHRDKTLIDLSNLSTIPVGIDKSTQINRVTDINFVDQKDDPCYQMLDSFPEILTPSFKPREVTHGVRHHIPTNCRPIQSKVRKLNPEKLEIAKKEFEKLVELGVCYRGKSEWASPLMVAPKPCGGWRVCGDYRRLNAATPDDKYPVKCLTDFNAKLSGMTIFSKVDLFKGYHQIPVFEHDVNKTAVITPFGLYIFPNTPFGLKNAGQDFQRMMDEILGDLPFCFVYLDDILIFSKNRKQHLEHLKQVFEILAANGLVVNRAKCILGVTDLDFLGYHVSAEGIRPLPEKVEAIRKVKSPTTIKELQRFLGMVGYYRRCIRAAAHHMSFLFEALAGKPKKLNWTSECESAFQATKEALAQSTMLRHPRPSAPLALTTDASDIAIGGVLEQRGPTGWEPLAFFSASLKSNEKKWPPFDRELLAAFRSIRHFRHMVEGRYFTLYTDHQSLVPALSKKTEPHTARQTYQLSAIAEFTTDIRYIEGKSNVVADALSRPNNPDAEELHVFSSAINSIRATEGKDPITHPREQTTIPLRGAIASANSNHAIPPAKLASFVEKPIPDQKREDLSAVINSVVSLGIDFEEMARDQPLDADFARISQDPNSGISFRKVPTGQHSLYVDISNGPARPFVPFSWRRRVFDAIHGLGHPGIERTREMIRQKFVWPSLRADVSKWARECLHCQRAKVRRHTVPEIGEFIVPNKRFAHLHADLTKMPESNGYCHLLTVIDRFTRWPAAFPLKDTTTESVIDALTHGWISSFGVPKAITTDRGSQFTSAIWKQLCDTWGIEVHLTTSYHPEANGLIERFHRRLKESLRAQCGDDRAEWYWRLPMALLAIRTTLKPDVGASPADLVYGEGLAVPGELLPDATFQEEDLVQQRKRMLGDLRVEVERLQPRPTSAHRQPQVHVPDDLQDATHVFVRRGGHGHPPLTMPYVGPYKVDSRTETGFNLHLPGRGIDKVALARLKPAYVDQEDSVSAEVDSQTPPPQSPPSPAARQPPPSPPDPQPPPSHPATRRPKSKRRGVPHIADFNQLQPAEGRPAEKGPDVDSPNVTDPYDGRMPVDLRLAPRQGEMTDNTQAPCDRQDPVRLIPLPLTISPHPGRRPESSATPLRPNDAPSEPLSTRPRTISENNLTPLPRVVTPHPRPVQSTDVNKRRTRPNYGPSLSAIMKSHLNI